MNSLISRTLTKTLKFRFPQISLPYSNYSSYSPKFQPRYEDPPLRFPGMEEQDENETKKMKIWPKPSEIPFQSKVANSLNFIGTVQMPVQFVITPDGKSWAGTYISQDSHSSSLPLLWISVIFEGDLAHTALAHLKRLQNVYISGHLTPEPLPINLKNDRVDVQVMVHDFYFVRGYHQKKSSRDY